MIEQKRTDQDKSAPISVVIPTRNRAQLIERALDSVFDQTYRPIELIVVDDGSVDDTVRVVREWSDRHSDEPNFAVRIATQQWQGGNPARNRGVRESTCAFVAFLDSDDTWDSEKLAKQIPVLSSDNDLGGVYCGLREIDLDTGKIDDAMERRFPSGWLLDELLVQDVTAPTSTWIVRREVFDSVGYFDTALQARQDWDMWIRLSTRYSIGCVPETLVSLGRHSGERTSTVPEKEIKAYKQIVAKYNRLRSRLSLARRSAARAAFYRRMGRVYHHQRLSFSVAMSYQLKAILIWPFDFDSYAAFIGMWMPRALRQTLHRLWNRKFGRTKLAIRSH